MTETDKAELAALIAAAIRPLETRMGAFEERLTARMDKLEARFDGLHTGVTQMFRELSDRMARLEARVETLTVLGGQLATRLIAIELDLSEIKVRLDRLSTDIIRGRTVEAGLIADLDQRVTALEALVKAP